MPMDLGVSSMDMGEMPMDLGVASMDLGVAPMDMGMVTMDLGVVPKNFGGMPTMTLLFCFLDILFNLQNSHFLKYFCTWLLLATNIQTWDLHSL